MSEDQRSFEDFMRQRQAAAQAYVCGDPGPLGRITTRSAPATFFGPRGGYREGAAEVSETYERDAGHFEPGSETKFEILHMSASDGLGYWVGLQHAQARMKGSTEAVPMKLRITELFRREADGWKLIHRHADMSAVEQR